MGLVIPREFTGNSDGEDFVWNKFKEYLEAGYVSIHNIEVDGKEIDVILCCPDRGILVIEIKGIYARNVVKVEDISKIIMKDKVIPSPTKQANGYRYDVINRLKERRIDSVYVIPTVCFPFINRRELEETGLSDMCQPVKTFTSEDFESKESLEHKVEEIFNWAYKRIRVKSLKKNKFNGKVFKNSIKSICKNIELPADINQRQEKEQELKKVNTQIKEGVLEIDKVNYSRLIYVQNESELPQEYLSQIIKDWARGVKIQFFARENESIDRVKTLIEQHLKSKGMSAPVFKLNPKGTYLFTIDQVDLQAQNFEILNGEGNQVEQHKDLLERLDEATCFNIGQYKVEHAALDNVIVKAGAGTGKTYSMISRINYLIWARNYKPEELRQAIAMITFTNDSTNTMKEKIQENFMNLYALTRNIKYLGYLDCVEEMNISTIHVMAKKIIQKYGSLIGLGKDFSIVSGEYKRRQILHNELNEFMKHHEIEEGNLSLTMYYLQQRLIKLLSKIDNKNIDIINDKAISFGNSNHIIDELISVLVKKVQETSRKDCDEHNSVALGDLIRRLKEIYEELKSNNIVPSDRIDFLFVDEFQDTDDIQIELMKNFQEIFKFKFFVVGDVKQCIYRFRGAVSEAFDLLDTEKKYNTISLNKNYRTDERLMTKLNTIFSEWDKKECIQYGKNDELKPTRNLEGQSGIRQPIIVNSEAEFKEKLVSEIRTIKEQLDERNRGKSKDLAKLAILVRYNWQIEQIKQICSEAGIEVETDIGGELFKIDPTIDLFKLVQALRYNQSPAYLYNLYTTAYVTDNLPKMDLIEANAEEVVALFNQKKPLPNWEKYIEALKSEPVLKVLRDIINDTLPWENFAMRVAEENEDKTRYREYYCRNLDQIFEKLIIGTNTDYLTINKISDQLEVMILTKQEEEARASYHGQESTATVLCTTIHKSKGLEYDTVFVPYTNVDISCHKPKGDVDLIFFDKKIGYRIKGIDEQEIIQNNHYKEFIKDEKKDRRLEETRILYVALTRAIREIVYMKWQDAKSKKIKNSWVSMMEGEQ